MTEPSMPQSPELPITGGSAASQAFRAELARQGRDGGVPAAVSTTPAAPAVQASKQPTPATQTNTGEARAAERKKVNGRARVLMPGADAAVGKMIDISLTGACVMLEDMFPSKKMCTLEIDIFHAGTRQLFAAPALSVYGVLVSGKGFKVGFQFGPLGEAARKCLAVLVQ